MEIKKPDRTQLKSYFVKNAIPTASNFADFIDGVINQKEDGIVKLPGEPLSVQAYGDDTTLKKAINLYKNFADPKPAWTLSLNPRVDPNDAATAKPGWSIGDADGNSKLFIDQTTGNVGIGTVEPGGYKLNVNGPALFTGNYLFVNSENAGRLRVGAAWGMPGLYSGDDGAKPLTLGVPAGQKVYLGVDTTDAFVEGGTGNSYFKGNVGIGTPTPQAKLQLVDQNQDANSGVLVLGPKNQSNLRLGYHADYSWIQSHGSKPLVINPLGNNVGIGTTAPGAALTVDAPGADTTWNTAAFRKASLGANWSHIHWGPTGDWYIRSAASAGKVILQDTGGNVGIGTGTPATKLEVAGDIRFNATLSTPGRMHITGEELLYLLHKQGVIIGKEWGGTGDLTVQGRIGTLGWSPVPRTPGWGGGIHTWDVEAEGTMWSRGGYQSGPRDLAENYLSDTDLEPGDVVSLDTKKDRIVRSEKPNDGLLLGVVSSKPGFLLNVDHEIEKGKLFPVALCGRVPCKAVNENGPIKRGDLLTSSSTLGHAMRAKPIEIGGEKFYRPGTIIGKALCPLNSGKGVIDVFVFSS